MKLSAIIGIFMTAIGFLVLAFGGEFWSAPFFILALMFFAFAWLKRDARRQFQFIVLADDFQTWGQMHEERMEAEEEPEPERKTFKPKEWPEDPKTDGLRKQLERTIPESPFTIRGQGDN